MEAAEAEAAKQREEAEAKLKESGAKAYPEGEGPMKLDFSNSELLAKADTLARMSEEEKSFYDTVLVEKNTPQGLTPTTYTFDYLFDAAKSQAQIYMKSMHEMVAAFCAGYNATIFAYGQTGSGKTFSMFGELHDPTLMGIVPRACQDIFAGIAEAEQEADEEQQLAEPPHSCVPVHMSRCPDSAVKCTMDAQLLPATSLGPQVMSRPIS